MTERVSIVVPVYDEGDRITACLEQICDAVTLPFEVLVVYDRADDSTAPFVQRYGDPRVRGVLNEIGPGPAKAIRAGFAAANSSTVVVTMADGSDHLPIVDNMVRLVERGAVVVAASRYMPGGAQVGGPRLKKMLSRAAGVSLYWLARVGTRDATNSFKAYSRQFVETVGIDADGGFEVGIELVAKARRLRLPVVEVPTIWLDRTEGVSHFRLRAWLPNYLRWYGFAFGPALTSDQLRRRR
jgi:glycosyltransferase involved in cell wall biosynthesis